ncbi:MAG: hypothetical protein QF479_01590 [Candidatus Poseidoniaceae archaeon]|jgi:fructose-specific phosphotransferase system IIC component|nr:hypothetical protein [Candidatus Poseidoniaceae archaeon]
MSKFQDLMANPVVRSLLIFSAFRAVYGAGILVVTWFLATSDEMPFWVSIVFLICSMVFSRVLFKFLKKKWNKDESKPSSSPDVVRN